ncbi:MAG: hypothetical protein GY880_03390 [Planctomycetaceae bacterium]|nr:hypothetical protein [Planctomycetaceae bacterium]MCP4476627.1 hypothetical protein [Planctomycetaceae bacterium]MCP4773262.1 hypothetical protein [Planctomycetaceae bacterium]
MYEQFYFVSPSTVAGPVIPGLQRGVVPQGLAYDPSRKLIFISNYAAKDPSVVSIINSITGKIVDSVALLDTNGEPIAV